MMSCLLFKNRRPSVKKPLRRAVRIRLRGIGADAIRRELLEQELIVRQIAIQRVDDPIAIDIRVVVRAVFLKDITLGVRIARQVEPVASPTFAITRRRQQSIHRALVSSRRRIFEKLVELRLASAASQSHRTLPGGAVSADRRRDLAANSWLASFSQMNASIGVRTQALAAAFAGTGGSLDRLKRPVVRDRFDGVLARVFVLGPWCAVLDPVAELRHFFRRELFLAIGRHREIAFAADRLEQFALVRFLDVEDRAFVGPLEEMPAAIKPQPVLLFLLAVAFEAMLGQERADFFFEEQLLRRAWLRAVPRPSSRLS